jgi:ATP-dependent Clp protease protease subunit
VTVDHHARAALGPEALFADHRTILLAGEITDASTNEIIAKLLYLDVSGTSPATLYIDSYGGGIADALAIRDTMDEIGIAVRTHCLGVAGGAAVLLLAHGARGERTADPTAKIILADCGDLAAIIDAMLAVDTGQPAAAIRRDCAAERRFDAVEARAYGLIDDSAR